MAAEAPIPKPDPARDKAAYEQAAGGKWQTVFADPCTGDWRQHWFLDGEVGTVTTGPEGMPLTAGREFKNEAHHMVLWTKQSFEGDLKIEYEYTRTVPETRCIKILYIQATCSGKGPYARDISQWNELRKVPAMATYFEHMHAYHFSYAAVLIFSIPSFAQTPARRADISARWPPCIRHAHHYEEFRK